MIYLFVFVSICVGVWLFSLVERTDDGTETFSCFTAILMLPMMGLVGLFVWLAAVIVLE